MPKGPFTPSPSLSPTPSWLELHRLAAAADDGDNGGGNDGGDDPRTDGRSDSGNDADNDGRIGNPNAGGDDAGVGDGDGGGDGDGLVAVVAVVFVPVVAVVAIVAILMAVTMVTMVTLLMAYRELPDIHVHLASMSTAGECLAADATHSQDTVHYRPTGRPHKDFRPDLLSSWNDRDLISLTGNSRPGLRSSTKLANVIDAMYAVGLDVRVTFEGRRLLGNPEMRQREERTGELPSEVLYSMIGMFGQHGQLTL